MNGPVGPRAGQAGSSGAVPVPDTERLQLPVIRAYTLSRVAFSLMGLMFGTYLMKFATDVLYIAPAVMGTVLAAAAPVGWRNGSGCRLPF